MKKVISVILVSAVIFYTSSACFADDTQTKSEEATILLSSEESEYVNSHKDHPLTVAISEDMAPVEYLDEKTGEYTGFIVELYELIAQKTGLSFTYISRGNSETTRNQIANGEVQFVSSLSNRKVVTDELNVTASTPIYSNTVSLVSKNTWTGEGNPDSVVAVKAGYPVFAEIAKSLGYTSIVEYDTFEDCVQAVNNDKADITLISTTGENVLLGHAYYANLTSILLTQTSGDYSIGVANNEDCEILLSIINKALADISPDWISQMRLQ